MSELKRYYAVMRKVGSTTPNSVHFSAKDVPDAIAELCAAAGVQNTNGLLSFEILQVLEGGAYARVALKEERKPRNTEERLAACTAPVCTPQSQPEKPDEVLGVTEKTYSPYTLSLAA